MDVDELIREHHRWLWWVAISLEKNLERQKDLYQVGAIAIWRAYLTYDGVRGTLGGHCRLAAKLKMREYAFGLARGKPKADQMELATDEISDFISSSSGGFNDLSYHKKEIMSAISELGEDTQKYIYHRFWDGWTNSMFKEVYGYDPSGLWTGVPRGAKMRLREKLEHLKEMA